MSPEGDEVMLHVTLENRTQRMNFAPSACQSGGTPECEFWVLINIKEATSAILRKGEEIWVLLRDRITV